jgi:indolepyruvate ferredoxin oxidoreductase beta subunit
VVLSLEPTEALRVLKTYGNPACKTLCNTRPVHAIGVICGDMAYPDMDELKTWISELSEKAWFLDATQAAMALGHPIFGNIMMIGALAGIRVLPLDREDFEAVISKTMSSDKVGVNLQAFDMGAAMVN